MKGNMKKYFLMTLAVVMMWSISFVAQADEVCYIHGDNIYNKTDYALTDGKTTVTWVNVSDGCYYDVELADNKEFRNAQQYTTNKTELIRHTSKQLTLIAPNATQISILEPLKDNTQIDLSKCSNVVELGVVADNTKGTKVLKLPKEKSNLRILKLAKIQLKTIDMNAYTNLQQLFMYRCEAKNVKVNKCKNLRYIYLCQCDKIKSLNLKSNNKLRGADFYKSPGLTKKTVKKSKSGKYTWNKGRWWEETAAYKKDMEEIYLLFRRDNK